MNAPRRLLYGIIATTIILLGTPAWADDGSLGPMKTLDATDSHGIRLSQYQLSIPDPLLGDPITHLVRMGWSAYVFWIGLCAHLVDWTMKMSWVTTITGPLSKAQEAIRTGILAPIGGTQITEGGLLVLLGTVAMAVCAVHIFRGRPSGWWGMLVSCLCGAAAVSLFAAPVTSIAGNDTDVAKPLHYAQRIGSEISSQMVAGKSTGVAIDASPEADPVAAQLVDVFVRPAHQALNYGISIDAAKPECTATYDEALKAGPYAKDAEQQRAKVGKCSGELKTYAEQVNTNWLSVLAVFWLPALLATLVLLAVLVLIWLSVLSLAWTAFWLNIHVIIGIAPGDTRGPLIRDLVTIVKELVFIATELVMLSMALLFVRATLGAPASDPIERFLIGSLLMIATFILVIANYIAHVKTGRSIAKRLMQRAQQTARETFSQRVTDWATRPAPGTRTANRDNTLQQPSSPSGLQQATGTKEIQQSGSNAPTSVPMRSAQDTQPMLRERVRSYAAESRLGQGIQRVRDSNTVVTLSGARQAGTATRTRFDAVRQGAKRAQSGHRGVDKVFDTVAGIRAIGHSEAAHPGRSNQGAELSEGAVDNAPRMSPSVMSARVDRARRRLRQGSPAKRAYDVEHSTLRPLPLPGAQRRTHLENALPADKANQERPESRTTGAAPTSSPRRQSRRTAAARASTDLSKPRRPDTSFVDGVDASPSNAKKPLRPLVTPGGTHGRPPAAAANRRGERPASRFRRGMSKPNGTSNR